MNANLRAFGAVVLSTIVLGACATKGFVRSSVRDERAARMAGDSTLANDVNGVRTEVGTVKSDVASLKTDVQSLRNDLNALRTEFSAKITAMEDGLKFAFPVTFGFDDATVREADKAGLDRFAKVVQKYYPNSMITVEGFADPAGSNSYNMELSKRRAETVAAVLAQNGLNGSNLRTVGYGESRQVNTGAKKDDPGAEANRRVVFVVETKGDATVAILPQDQ
jgi:outer membrane protein OmpA-like peptidoglycan-associated protein